MQPNANLAAFVSESEIEALLAAVAARTRDPIAGIFGPQSISWRINRESALFLGAGRAALLQLAHPWVTAALAKHSTVMSRPITRFHNTFRIVFTMIFGSLEQAMAAARHLYLVHTRIGGQMTEDIGQWKHGSRYEANEIGALRWVFSTLVESAVIAHDRVLPPLSAAEREQYYVECRILAGLFGIPAAELPDNWAAFIAYNHAMHDSDQLGVTATARTMAHDLLAGVGSWIHPPFWYRALTTEWMPERFRREFALPFGAPEQRSAARASRRLPAIYRLLPAAIRFTGPWRQARSRLAGKPVSVLTRWNNRFWIGQTLLPFDASPAVRGSSLGRDTLA